VKKISKRADAKPISPKDWKVSGHVVVPCPFCGNLARFQFVSDAFVKPELEKGFWSLSCRSKDCTGAPMSFGSSKKQAAFEYNQRSSGGWISPATKLPDDDMCVLIRIKSADWPLALGWRDADVWRDLSSDEIDNEVTGCMQMEDASAILDTITFARKGGAK
jgi:hypothetical protein